MDLKCEIFLYMKSQNQRMSSTLSSSWGNAVLVAVAVVALMGLFFDHQRGTGNVVSVIYAHPSRAHVVGSSMALKCISDAYCPPNQLCVRGSCMDSQRAASMGIVGIGNGPSGASTPVPNYASYDPGGNPSPTPPSPNNDNPGFERSDFSRHEPLTKY